MITEKTNFCFVLMPFNDLFRNVYDEAIKPACMEAGYICLRVDDLKGTYNINRRIIESIFNCDMVIADLTGWNANVFYELGVAHAIDTKTVMIIQSDNHLPFDVSSYRCIIYDQTELGLRKLKKSIAESLSHIDEWSKKPTNPVHEFKPYEAFIPTRHLESMQRELLQKQDEILALQQQLEKGFISDIFMEEITVNSLLGHMLHRIARRHFKNPVKLSHLGLHCRIARNSNYFETQLTYRIKGWNTSNQELSGLHLVVAGDYPMPLSKLKPSLYHRHFDSEKADILLPELLGSDGKVKLLFLPFVSPGIAPGDEFDIEFSLNWPNLIYPESPKDYFFLDNFDFEDGTDEIQIALEFDGVAVGSVNAFSLDNYSRQQRLGAVPPDVTNPSIFKFKRSNPENERYFILVFDIVKEMGSR